MIVKLWNNGLTTVGITMTFAKRKPVRRKTTPRGKSPAGSVASRIVSRLTAFTKALDGNAVVSDKFTVRTIRLNLQPTSYDPAAVRKTRGLLKLSQPLFAKFLGVAAQTVRAWERGSKGTTSPAIWLADSWMKSTRTRPTGNVVCNLRWLLKRFDP